jgi:uncharacterized membrane protein HdeD (DUF308 family)
MSDPLDRGARSREPTSTRSRGRLAAHIWWIFLVTGIAGVILGSGTLAGTPDSSVTLAKIAGIAFVIDAVLLALLADQAQEWSGFYLLAALTAIAGVALCVPTLARDALRVAFILGATLTLRGVIDVLVAWGGISDFTETAPRLWEWVFLAVGIVILLLGVVALISRGGSTSLLLAIVSSEILARGIGMLAISYRLRTLT